ncbi:hypothetical protein B0T14DRAFT_150388 [Immersiella caudata]|uniref:Uncharacterized protein n=1 Tax=Immersiella caudata TaxID=314043 RepID=A0AA39WVV6_9PEZI|nr:hypothetical protein B0T14DRAFT_150388 [Immersiella caudata]
MDSHDIVSMPRQMEECCKTRMFGRDNIAVTAGSGSGCASGGIWWSGGGCQCQVALRSRRPMLAVRREWGLGDERPEQRVSLRPDALESPPSRRFAQPPASRTTIACIAGSCLSVCRHTLDTTPRTNGLPPAAFAMGLAAVGFEMHDYPRQRVAFWGASGSLEGLTRMQPMQPTPKLTATAPANHIVSSLRTCSYADRYLAAVAEDTEDTAYQSCFL